MQFHYVTRAIFRSHGHVLVVKEKGSENSFLPGGHIEIGEAAEKALQREFEEECGIKVDIEYFMGAVESQWVEHQSEHHEINLIFSVNSPDVSYPTGIPSLEPHLVFQWVPESKIDQVNLLPAPMVTLIQQDTTDAFWGSSLLEK
ncbi:NUDIX domain-containing protein [Thaumasiovibrio subtropicus]|uniref:NUDIX domain-containing protein n=1 Tax=Thaumasiovibrio subtropicus TaxID=1891207 RepID=UPI000B35637F|nr:NUDIX domain-containing protein [Thaumasiovibrio subtropicus]